MRVLLALVFVSTSVLPAGAQPFSNADRSRAKYAVADATPSKACSDLSAFAGDGIVSIAARVVAATADTPQHCRVTGVITPEVAFEINLPDRWNRRFYMTGNGGLAGDALDTPTNADRTGALTKGFDGAHQRARRAERLVHPRQSTRRSTPHIAPCTSRRGGKEDRSAATTRSRSRSRGTPARTAAARGCSKRSAFQTTSMASSPTPRGWIRPAS
jgi:hypothetical protein